MKIKVENIIVNEVNKEIYSLSSIDELMSSIKLVGLLQNPVINSRTKNLLSGHRRLEAVTRLGWDELEVDTIDINEDDEILYLIHYNQTRVKSVLSILREYDFLRGYYKKNKERLGLKGVILRGMIAEDLKMSDGQLARLLKIRKESPDSIELIDKGILSINQAYILTQRNEKEKKSRTIINENWNTVDNTKEFQFYQKSSNIMDELEDESVDLILTSPPFWKLRSYTDNDILGSEKTPEEYVENIVNHLYEECYRVLKNSGSFFIELGDTFIDGNLQNIPHRVAIEMNKRGFIQRNSMVVKRSNPKPSSSKNNLTPTYSMMFHFVKSLNYNYQRTLTKISSNTKPSHPPRHRTVGNGSIKSTNPYIPNSFGKNIGDYIDEDILRVAVSNQKYSTDIQHPAQFPRQLVWLIINSTVYLPFINKNYSSKVLDPFAGALGVYNGTKWFNDNLKSNIKFVGYDIKKWF
jgi:DNA modification methylase